MEFCNCAQCCFCKAYMVGRSRYRVTIENVDALGITDKVENIYPNVCNECMDEVRKAIGNLDMSKPPGASNESC